MSEDIVFKGEKELAKEFERAYKILVLGDGGVGKTTLVHRLEHGAFLKDTIKTIGVQFGRKELYLEEGYFKLLFWDVSGQDQFRSLHQYYCKGVNGVIIGFDLRRYLTFSHLPNWFKIVDKHAPDAVELLVGTKADLERAIKQEDIDKLIKQRGSDYIETSSKTGQNVEQVSQYMAKEIYTRDLAAKAEARQVA